MSTIYLVAVKCGHGMAPKLNRVIEQQFHEKEEDAKRVCDNLNFKFQCTAYGVFKAEMSDLTIVD